MCTMVDKIDVMDVVNIAEAAGRAILEVYESGAFGVEYKDDASPLTKADTVISVYFSSPMSHKPTRDIFRTDESPFSLVDMSTGFQQGHLRWPVPDRTPHPHYKRGKQGPSVREQGKLPVLLVRAHVPIRIRSLPLQSRLTL